MILLQQLVESRQIAIVHATTEFTEAYEASSGRPDGLYAFYRSWRWDCWRMQYCAEKLLH
jgi:hypothetical protein